MSAQRVPASLSMVHAGAVRDAAVDASVGITPRRAGGHHVVLSIVIEGQTEWVLELDRAPAAYLAGTLAIEAGEIAAECGVTIIARQDAAN